MKKAILLLITMCCMTVSDIYRANGSENNSMATPTREEINIEKTYDPPIPRPRSVIEIIEAYLYRSDSAIEIYFNYMFGDVTITMENAEGDTVYTYECDTDTEEVVRLAVPAESGEYTIIITGQDLSATGVFTI